MAKIIFNNTYEFNFSDFSRNTYFGNEEITSDGMVNNISGDNAQIVLQTLTTTPITSIQIKKEGQIIYNLEDINATVVNISDGFNGNNVYLNAMLHFNI